MKSLAFILLFCASVVVAQGQTTPLDSVRAAQELKKETRVPLPQPKIQFRGLFQGRFLASNQSDVAVTGKHQTNDSAVTNSFEIKRARIQTRAIISDKTEVVIMMNLADFKTDPKNKVLENAFIQYTYNSYLKITAGQFRPIFGLENTYPIDIVKSIDFSNQYYEFGKNGWEGFQIGLALEGSVKYKELPIRYAFTLFNGNGRNLTSDTDNGKLYTTRFEFGLSKKNNFNLGINGGTGNVFDKRVFALGVDITSDIKLGNKTLLEMQIEAKQANNHNFYFQMTPSNRLASIDSYQIRGIYFLPNLRYEIDYRRLSSIEISCRYEYLDTNFKLNSNPRQTFLPMLGLEFLKQYNARLQFGYQIDRYKKNIDNTTFYSNELFIFQVQSRL